jgi:hypothetical protein
MQARTRLAPFDLHLVTFAILYTQSMPSEPRRLCQSQKRVLCTVSIPTELVGGAVLVVSALLFCICRKRSVSMDYSHYCSTRS